MWSKWHTHTHTQGTLSHTHTDRHTYPSEQLEAEVKAIREAFKVIAHMKRFVGSLHSVGHWKPRGVRWGRHGRGAEGGKSATLKGSHKHANSIKTISH